MSKLVAEVVHTNKVETDAGARANFRQVGNTYDYNGVSTPTEVLDTFPTWCNRIEIKFSNLLSFSNTQVTWFTFGNSSGRINPFNSTAGSVQSSWQALTVVDGISNINICTVYGLGSTVYNSGSMFADRIYPSENIWRCYGNGMYRVGTLTGQSGTWATETEQTDLSASNPTTFGITRQVGQFPIYGKWTTYYHEY
jgi:hypothetical protein